MLGLKPWEYERCELDDLIELYDAYMWALSNSNDNRYVGALICAIAQNTHYSMQAMASNVKPFHGEVEDYMFHPRESLRKEAERLLLDGDNE